MTVPSNPQLVQAIQELLDATSGDMAAYFKPVLDELVSCTLIAGNEDDELSTYDTDDEEELLALFTDMIELHMYAPNTPWIAIPAEEAIRRVASGEYDGLVINPRGRAFQLTREDVLELFDID